MHIGGQVFLTINGKGAPLKSSKSSNSFITLYLTAATGALVMFIIVYAAAELEFLVCFGYDFITKEKYDRSKPIEEQIGAGKCFPGAPECKFWGKTVPAIAKGINDLRELHGGN